MQGALVIFALITFVCAQTTSSVPPGGCCFYSDKAYQNEVACTNAGFTIAELNFASKATFKGIQSFFCEDGWSAAIMSKGEAQELIDCGDTVPETTTHIPVDSVTIGPCLQRRCCFYSGKNKDGNEFCMYTESTVEAELKNAQSEAFLVGECVQEWKAELTGKNGKLNIDCGVTLDLDGKNNYDKITLTPCAAPKAESEAIEDTFVAEELVDTFQDQAVADANVEVADDLLSFDEADLAVADANVELADDQLLADASLDQAITDVANDDASFAVADANVDDELLAFNHDGTDADFADQAVADFSDEDLFAGDYNADQAVMDAFDEEFLDNFADQAVGDNFDQVFGDQDFDAAQAVQESAATLSNSATSVFVSMAVVVASLVALLF